VTTELGAELVRLIKRDGPLPVAEFMRLCLSHPQHGYYRKQEAIGAGGDFITAPEISQMFGELLGLWAAEMWAAMGRPSSVHVVELGPGRGTLMADALRAAERAAPEFRRALDVHLVEINHALQRQQASALAGADPCWHDDFDSVLDGPLIVIANEFFDALPVRQVVRAGDNWHERVVTCDQDRFVFALGGNAPAPHVDAPDGAIVEIAPERERYVAKLATRIAAQGGAALIVDYGPPLSGFGDTLQAIRAQKKVDPLAEPGLADLTTHVDFARLAQAARSAGGAVYGPLPQARLLQRLGIAARTAILLRRATETQAGEIEAAVHRLIGSAEMGTLFQALAVAHPSLPVPPGFDRPAP
jgi:NADH dehydrogenase [ubiquinone] 1 alpha subcomplex assembly factor 7